MSKVVKAVIDLPTLDYKDLEGVQETLAFLQTSQIVTAHYSIVRQSNHILIHSNRDYEWVKIYNDGRLEYDRHYGMESDQWREEILQKLARHYPQVRKALDLLNQAGIKAYSMNYNKETQEILIEAEI